MTKNGNSIFIFCNIYCIDASSTEGCWDKKVLSDKPLIYHFIIKTNPTHQVHVRSGVGKPFHKEPCGFCSIEGFLLHPRKSTKRLILSTDLQRADWSSCVCCNLQPHVSLWNGLPTPALDENKPGNISKSCLIMTQITADVEAEVSFIKIPQFPTGDRQCDYNLLVMYVSGLNSCWVGAFPIRLREFLNVLASSVFLF